ncbi:MAG: hypothetical protein L0Y54_17345 [Sporichthyaceae bacterium]|nr:hypothetical protein [Sporichthyaceae bacterium]
MPFRGWVLAGGDPVPALAGLRRGRHPELVVQPGGQLLVGTQRQVPLARIGVRAHQAGDCVLVEWIERHQPGEHGRGPGQITGAGELAAPVQQQPGEPDPQLFPARLGPRLERVLDQQIVGVQLQGGRPIADLDRTLERVHVDPQPGCVQAEQLVPQPNVRRAECLPGKVHRLAQVGRRGVPAELGPEQIHQVLTVQPAIGRQREQLDQSLGSVAAPGLRRHRPGVDLDPEPAEQPHLQLRGLQLRSLRVPPPLVHAPILRAPAWDRPGAGSTGTPAERSRNGGSGGCRVRPGEPTPGIEGG